MKVSKTTEKYILYQEGINYILNIGEIKKEDDTTTELLFEEVANPEKTSIRAMCGCTTTNKKVIDSSSFTLNVKYTRCENVIDKTIVINEGKTDTLKIKIKGTCR